MRAHNFKKVLSCILAVAILAAVAVPTVRASEETAAQSETDGVGYDPSLVSVPENLDSILDIKNYDQTLHKNLTEFKITDVAGYKKLLELTSRVDKDTQPSAATNQFYRLENCTVYLAADLDFNGEKGITPVGGWKAGGGIFDSSSGKQQNLIAPGWSGTFDGLGHTIKNLNLVAPSATVVGEKPAKESTSTVQTAGYFGEGYIGLFRNLTKNGCIKNLILDESVTVSAGEWNTTAVGALVGSINTNSKNNAMTQLTISNIWNKATVTGQANNAGSLIGRVYQATVKIDHCTNDGNITTSAFVDGKDDYQNKPTTFGYGVGGLVGIVGTASSGEDRTTKITVANSVNNGTITSDHSPVGGIVGAVGTAQKKDWLTLSIEKCVNTGTLVQNSSNNIGGILGVNNNMNVAYGSVSVTDSVFSGTVTNNGNGYFGSIATGDNVRLSGNKVDGNVYTLDSTDMKVYGHQTSNGRYTTEDAQEVFSVRIVSLHKNIGEQSKITYHVTIKLADGSYYASVDTDKVYTSLIADNEKKNASELDSDYGYLATLKITDIPIGTNTSIQVSIVPVITDLNGNTYVGSSKNMDVTVPAA